MQGLLIEFLLDSGHCEAWLRCLQQNAFGPANKLYENLKAITGVLFTSRDILGDINRYHVMNNEQKACRKKDVSL